MKQRREYVQGVVGPSTFATEGGYASFSWTAFQNHPERGANKTGVWPPDSPWVRPSMGREVKQRGHLTQGHTPCQGQHTSSDQWIRSSKGLAPWHQYGTALTGHPNGRPPCIGRGLSCKSITLHPHPLSIPTLLEKISLTLNEEQIGIILSKYKEGSKTLSFLSSLPLFLEVNTCFVSFCFKFKITIEDRGLFVLPEKFPPNKWLVMNMHVK